MRSFTFDYLRKKSPFKLIPYWPHCLSRSPPRSSTRANPSRTSRSVCACCANRIDLALYTATYRCGILMVSSPEVRITAAQG